MTALSGMGGSISPIALPDSTLIHVWRLSIPVMRAADVMPVLAEDERIRAARFVFEKDRDQFVIVRGWLRRLCGAYMDRAPDALRFQYGPAGKPALAADDASIDLRFNVSHSRDCALLAFSLGRDVGVDVEHIEDRLNVLDLAQSCFSETELRSFQACAPGERLGTFFRYWTSKEAYIKALGDGLSMPLQEFTVDVCPDTPVWRVHAPGSTAPPAVVQRLSVPAEYAAAVAANGTDWRVSLRDLPRGTPTAL
jgi:4'-phosphopantetheinyl transferase